jgi:type IV fimbrial biogenesis protein FimT
VRSLSSSRRGTAGFTVVELMVSVAIVALLSAIAVPTMRGVLTNNRIRAAAASLQNGLTLARAEAVRLNVPISFVLTSGGWNILLPDGTLLHQASGKEHATGLTITPTLPATSTVVFDAFGRRASGPTRIDVVAANPPTSNYRPLRVQVTGGGASRLCNPAVASTEPMACL